MNFNRKARNSK